MENTNYITTFGHALESSGVWPFILDMGMGLPIIELKKTLIK